MEDVLLEDDEENIVKKGLRPFDFFSLVSLYKTES